MCELDLANRGKYAKGFDQLCIDEISKSFLPVNNSFSLNTVVREIFVLKKFSYARMCMCTKIKCTKFFIAVYSKYYGKGSPVRNFFDTKI